MEEYLPRQRLLIRKGRLAATGWAADDAYIYNKETIRSRYHRREWEF